jgi:flagellar motor switch protein FliG
MSDYGTMSPSSASVVIGGLRKSAILMLALGAEASANVLKHLDADEVERLSWEMARIREVEPSLVQVVVEEFNQRLDTDEFIERAGIEYVKDVLELAVGTEKARDILTRLGRRTNTRPFETIRTMDPAQLFQIIQGEHPQTIALVVSHLPAISAGAVLSGLPAAVQAEVATRIASMDATTPDVIHQVEQVIMDRMASVDAQDFTSVGGATALVEILNQVDRATERTILDGLESANPALADAIKEKMFVFEDITTLDNRVIQTILREVEQEDLRLSLKGVGDNVRECIFRNISTRAAETLREDLETMGAVRVRDVEAAQKKIVAIVRRLEDAGELTIRRTKEDDVIE